MSKVEMIVVEDAYFCEKEEKKRNIILSKLEGFWLLYCKILFVSLCLGK